MNMVEIKTVLRTIFTFLIRWFVFIAFYGALSAFLINIAYGLPESLKNIVNLITPFGVTIAFIDTMRFYPYQGIHLKLSPANFRLRLKIFTIYMIHWLIFPILLIIILKVAREDNPNKLFNVEMIKNFVLMLPAAGYRGFGYWKYYFKFLADEAQKDS